MARKQKPEPVLPPPAAAPCEGWSGREAKGELQWTPVRDAEVSPSLFTADWGGEPDPGTLTAGSEDGESYRGRWERAGRAGIAEFLCYRNRMGFALLGRWLDPRGRMGRWFFVLERKEGEGPAS